MADALKDTGKEIVERWHERMPRFFYWIVVTCSGILLTAVTINMAVPQLGGELGQWWQDIYTPVLCTCIGIIAVCKFTVAGGYKKINPDDFNKT
jgi:hypothetical protein